MTPGDDCGVTGGCGACPLFAANVCGDPGPYPPELELPGMWESADFTGGLDEVRPPAPVCVQTPSGVVPCGSSRLCRSREEVAAARTGYRVRNGRGETVRVIPDPAEALARDLATLTGAPLIDARPADPDAAVWAYLDAPDVDPAEPKPDGAGCCGGGCGG
ncbi:hypothetical protein [Micromonospora sp. KC213]|uniref:hypothetical protein n=1 Tax=Micromonospora sp. KC213 TaxID=2530378 RepID=UPI00104DEE11|nr:hypothetical protein [Micromonospora sp. KC213]TDC35711.1 hypothetical protein E1166_23225 [Micromonospora sp. KC213]